MACASRSLMNLTLSANGCTFKASPKFLYRRCLASRKPDPKLIVVRASADESDCNEEECAPDKEVGKVSVEWLAGEKTKVVGTFPPRKRGWTGYVEKDTAGQTNIYSVEPTVYVAESAISSGSASSSSDGSENTVAIAGGLALIFVAGALLVLRQVGNTEKLAQTAEYSGQSLSYYIDKFKPPEIIQVSAPPPSDVPSAQAESPTPEVPRIQAATGDQTEASS
ncbi:hypothetical protein MLD38_008829 [Melastoma candidum]|uniref:Uncharacterized protein n=1 Tax=Melastoma candidum TaxID=119954 RepID=A0ACB9RV29_9MYRT|nr:hypothetical protein MLD38_008829 [Melastoma candidum]